VGVGARKTSCPGGCSTTLTTQASADLMRDLNRIYREEPALWEVDFSHEGLPLDRAERRAQQRARVRAASRRTAGEQVVLHRETSRPVATRGIIASACRSQGAWTELLNTDSAYYGGTGCRETWER